MKCWAFVSWLADWLTGWLAGWLQIEWPTAKWVVRSGNCDVCWSGERREGCHLIGRLKLISWSILLSTLWGCLPNWIMLMKYRCSFFVGFYFCLYSLNHFLVTNVQCRCCWCSQNTISWKYTLWLNGVNSLAINPYPTAFPYGNGMVLHFYQQQESSTTKTVHKIINKGL